MGIKGVFKAIARPLRSGSKSQGREQQAPPPRRVEVQRVLSISRPLDIDTSSTSSDEEREPLPAELEGLHPPEAPETTSQADVGLRPTAGRREASQTAAGTPQKRDRSPSTPRAGRHVGGAAGSPFIDIDSPITPQEAAKLILMFPMVLLRTLLLLVTVVTGYIVMAALMALLPGGGKGGHGVRHAVVQSWIQVLCHVALFLSGFFSVKVTGRQHLKQAKASRAIVIFNHLSYVDPVLLVSLIPLSGVAKAGVANLPFIGAFARAMQWLFVERRGSSDHANAHTVKGDAVEAIQARVADEGAPMLVMAPEATTKAAQCLLKFRRGAFAGGHPVCPILLAYPHRAFNPAWGIVPSTPLHVYRLLAQPLNRATIQVLPTYFPSQKERADPAAYAAGVRQAMAAALRAPLVEQGITEERRLVKGGVTTNLAGSRVIIPKSKAA
ncbi:PGA2 [Auxenochlorella protothecoides x Auxenochlorella symbiontica]